tara:strand:- start:472 stop:633 length:162 start_codon:yes stop_codon:yes gene_type:complete
MRIHKPDGAVITFWLAAETEEDALKACEERGMVDIEKIIDDTESHPWVGEQAE